MSQINFTNMAHSVLTTLNRVATRTKNFFVNIGVGAGAVFDKIQGFFMNKQANSANISGSPLNIITIIADNDFFDFRSLDTVISPEAIKQQVGEQSIDPAAAQPSDAPIKPKVEQPSVPLQKIMTEKSGG